MFLIAREGGREVLWLSAGENLCATSSTFAGRRHMIGKVVTGCVAILPYHTATQDRGSECRDFGFISPIVTALFDAMVNRKCTQTSKKKRFFFCRQALVSKCFVNKEQSIISIICIKRRYVCSERQ